MLGRMELTGTVKAIIYRSEDTGFTVLELTNEAGEDMTAIGEMPLAGVGERVELWLENVKSKNKIQKSLAIRR